MNDRPVESVVAEFLSGALAVGDALRVLRENVTIAVLRRPTLGLVVKGTGLSERHFPPELRVAFKIATTKSQDEIRRLVMLQDPRVWPLYGKRIVEWNEAQARAVARQIVDSVERGDDHTPIDAVRHDDGFSSAPAAKMAAPTYLTPEERALFEKTHGVIRQIMGSLVEVSSKRLVDELARIEGGPWAEWGKRRKPITQRALARLLRPHEIFPVDVGPEHARRKGYRRAQFEGRPV
jgi:hypothetical protein